MHRKYLFDVDGHIVRGFYGEPVNLYSKGITFYIAQGYIRLIYDLTREYRYIVVDEEQYHRFQQEREIGSTSKDRVYHVYPDDDTTLLPLYHSIRRR